MAGYTVESYRQEEQIGSGGVGEVYLAEALKGGLARFECLSIEGGQRAEILDFGIAKLSSSRPRPAASSPAPARHVYRSILSPGSG